MVWHDRRMEHDALTVVAELVVAAAPGRRALVAVDGAGGSGTTTFAAHLAERVRPRRPVLMVHADDFLAPPHVRHARGRYSPEGFWLDAYDVPALVRDVLDPLGLGGHGRYRATRADGLATPGVALVAPPDAVVLVEGTFLLRDGLAHRWHVAVHLDVPLSEATRRMAAREGRALDDPVWERYAGAQRLYTRAAHPRERATVVVDTTDVTAPRVSALRRPDAPTTGETAGRP